MALTDEARNEVPCDAPVIHTWKLARLEEFLLRQAGRSL